MDYTIKNAVEDANFLSTFFSEDTKETKKDFSQINKDCEMIEALFAQSGYSKKISDRAKKNRD